MFSCRDLLNKLDDYLDGQVTADLRRELEAHLAHCRMCAVLVDGTRKSVTIVTESRSFQLPADASTKIMAKIREAALGQQAQGRKEDR